MIFKARIENSVLVRIGDSILKQQIFNLGQYTTVHQAEILAINTASIAILEEEIRGELINFYIDSRSALGSLSSYTVQDKSFAEECKRHLNKLCEYGNVVRLNWIPGHADQKGNEVADRLLTFKGLRKCFHSYFCKKKM